MKSRAIVTVVLALIVVADAQDQSACPSPRHDAPLSICATGGDTNRNISVRVAALHADPGKVGFEDIADTVERVQQHVYRACDMGVEITNIVKESFQRFGFFCTDVEPIPAAKLDKNAYEITLRVHPGSKYRLSEVLFSGATVLTPNELRSALHMKESAVFDAASLRRGLEALQKTYLKKGHPVASIVPVVKLDQSEKAIKLEIKIVEKTTLQ